MRDNVTLRPAQQSDVNFILNSMLSGIRDSNQQLGLSSFNFFDNVKEVIKLLLETADTLIACDSEEQDVIYGYCIFQDSTLHYVYVKHSLRRLGLGRDLVLEAMGRIPTYYTIESKVSQKLANRFNLKYNPYFLITGKHL
jgi:ribosomal protein S18 acetylase RimI-like enzyme